MKAELSAWAARLAPMWEATAKRDKRALRENVRAAASGAFEPAAALALAVTPAGREVACAWFEALDDALGAWLDVDPVAPKELLRPHEGGFELGALLLLPMYLRETGSRRMAAPAPFPEKLTSAALARAMLRADALSPLDYGGVMRSIEPWTRAAFITWFLGCYLASPLEGLDPAVIENRAAATAAFVAHHRSRPGKAPFTLALGASSFAAPSFAKDARAFLSTLSDAVLEPAFAPAAPAVREPTSGEGVVLTIWRRDSAVHRCMAPVVTRLKDARRFVVDPASAWEGEVKPAARPAAIVGLAQEIARERLDFLFYPEVGLTPASRWLATRRLARVQATGYGHPVTTGSSAMDYFVGGACVERDGEPYRERLVLLPGLGVTSTEPPMPANRTRPEDAKEPAFVSFASYNKLTPDLCAAWERILASCSGSRLELVPGLPPGRVDRVARALAPIFRQGAVVLTPELPRQRCVDLLAEADVYLDSFPFGGYNTLVEALACGCPIVTLEGRHAYGRYGAALLRELELPEWMIATTIEQYVSAAIRLATDVPLRAEVRARLARPRVVERLCRTDACAHFDAAVEWMRREGPTRGAPVYIEAGAPPRVMA